jgi:hypothetical protein
LTSFEDGLSHSCQAAGEFILSKINDLGMEVQARFKRKNSQVTLATAVAAKGGQTDKVVQLSVRESDQEI